MTRVVLNRRGFVHLRNSPKVRAELEKHADRIAASAGPGFEVRPGEYDYGRSGRSRFAVVTGTHDAMRAEAHHGALTAAVGGNSTWDGTP